MRRLVPALLLLTVLLPVTEAAMAYPTFTPGDRWEYDTFWSDREGGQFRERNALVVESRETIEVDNKTYDTHRMRKISLRQTPDGSVISSTNTSEWHRVTDGAIVRVESVRNQLGREPQIIAGHYAEPCVTLPSPLEVGKQWRHECTLLIQGASGVEERKDVHEGNVARLENVSLPIGNFTAYVIESPSVVGIGHDLVWYSPEACGRIRLGSDHPNSVPADVKVVRCQATGVDSHPARQPEPEDNNESPGVGVALILAGVALALLVAGRRAKRS